jgi:hypothetical protein
VARSGPETSGARAAGVSWNSQARKWVVQIQADTGDGKSKNRNLGLFVNEVDAALAYDHAAREYHKDKAKLNFPDLPPLHTDAPKRARGEQVRLSEGQQGRLTSRTTIPAHAPVRATRDVLPVRRRRR